MSEFKNHNIGDLVCWSDLHDVLGYIHSCEWTETAGYIYVVKWFLSHDDPQIGLFCETSHTDLGINNMKRYLSIRLSTGQ